MAGAADPRRSIVAIYHSAIGDKKNFLGSGAFVTPRHVLTAKHVVDSARYSAPFQLDLVDGYANVPAENIHRHQSIDVALIEFDRPFSDQGLVALDCQSSALEGISVVLYGVNPDTLNRDQTDQYTLGTWKSESGDYLFDHAQRKGFSGGIVVHAGIAIGVITQRHTSEQQGVTVPLYKVREWLQSLVSETEFAEYFSNKAVIEQHRIALAQSEFADQVRDEIGKLLNRPRLQALRDALLEQNVQNDPHGKAQSLLVPEQQSFDFEDSIHLLHRATAICLDQISETRPRALSDIGNGAKDVLGWLVLLAVNDAWLRQRDELPDTLKNATHIEIPVETEAGTEVVVSRVRIHRARLTLHPDGIGVVGINRVDTGDLELGIGRPAAMLEVKKLIWKTVMKRDPPVVFKDADENMLRDTLKVRAQRGDSYYIIVPEHLRQSVGDGNTLLNQLRQELPVLRIFLIGASSGEQVLVMDESMLLVLIREFLLMLGEYS